MTTIAFKDGIMAADRRLTDGNCKLGQTTKIFKIRDHLVGLSGDTDRCCLMRSWFEGGALEDEWPLDPEKSEASMLVATPDGRLFCYDREPVPIRIENEFYAAGSGMEFAMAAMYLGCSAERAVEVACDLDKGSGNGIDVLCLDKKAS